MPWAICFAVHISESGSPRSYSHRKASAFSASTNVSLTLVMNSSLCPARLTIAFPRSAGTLQISAMRLAVSCSLPTRRMLTSKEVESLGPRSSPKLLRTVCTYCLVTQVHDQVD